MDKIKSFFEKAKMDKEEKTFYYIDLALAESFIITYSFSEENREEIQNELKQKAFNELIKSKKYNENKVDWVDYMRYSVGNMFDTKKEAEKKLEKVISILNSVDN